MQIRPATRRGFSILELVTVMAIVAVTIALSMPLFARTQRRDDLRRAARSLIGDLNRARSLAASGYRTNVSPPWAPTDRSVNAGVTIVSPNTYALFIDRDGTTDGDEITVAVMSLPNFMTITSPLPGQEIRFRPNGTVVAPANFVIADAEQGMSRTIIVSGGGAARIQ